jgi:gas vesicle protein
MNDTNIIEIVNHMSKNINDVLTLNNSLWKKYDEVHSVDGIIIGTGQADYTKDSSEYTLHANNKEFILIDIPGIEGAESKYESIIQKAINKAHLVIYVNGANKKPEAGTVKKIKKYLRNDSDVYAIFNVHHMPKKTRDVEIDGTYEEELAAQYVAAENELLIQTKDALMPVLGSNFKKGLCINGLLAFCGSAYDNQNKCTTIIRDVGRKKLRSSQNKFASDYNNDYARMIDSSRLSELTNIINEHVENFDEFIIESNKKKLIKRLTIMKDKLTDLKKYVKDATDKFSGIYDNLSTDLISANKNFQMVVEDDIARESVQDMKNTYLEKLYALIENMDGDVSQEDLEAFFEENKSRMQRTVETNVKRRYNDACQSLEKANKQAQERFKKDLQFTITYDVIKIADIGTIDVSEIADSLSYNLSDFASGAFKVGGFAMAGAGVGAAFGGIGAIPGAIAGAIVGVIFSFLDFFSSRESRISKAKKKSEEVFDKIEETLIDNINSFFYEKGLIENIQKQNNIIEDFIDNQKSQLKHVNLLINKLLKNVDEKIETLGGKKYGEI